MISQFICVSPVKNKNSFTVSSLCDHYLCNVVITGQVWFGQMQNFDLFRKYTTILYTHEPYLGAKRGIYKQYIELKINSWAFPFLYAQQQQQHLTNHTATRISIHGAISLRGFNDSVHLFVERKLFQNSVRRIHICEWCIYMICLRKWWAHKIHRVLRMYVHLTSEWEILM